MKPDMAKQPTKTEHPVEDITRLANLLEANLEAHGILARVMEINFMPKHLEFQLEVAQGVAITEFENLSRDIALFLASPTGNIELVAPIPGTHRIGINLPRRTEKNKQPLPESKPAEVIVREKTLMYSIRNQLADVLFLIAEGIAWVARKLYLSETIEKPFVSTADNETPKDET